MSTPLDFERPNAPNRKYDKNVDLAAVLGLIKEDTMYSLNCHAIGTVKSFNPVNRTVSVQINYLRTAYTTDPRTREYIPEDTAYPLLIDCPVIVLSGGLARLTFPIVPGDVCMVLFNDRSIDSWFATGQVGPLSSLRAHSLSDGVALIGLTAGPRAPAAYDAVRAVLSNGNAMVGVGPELVKISNDLYTLNGLLQNLVTEIKNLVTQTALITVTPGSLAGPSSVPLNAAAITAITATLTATATQIAGLLE